MTVYFTADPHYGHANVIKFCNRPFSDVEEMNRTMIDNWNSVVAPGDRVYILGDFSFYDEEKTGRILDRLVGNKYLIYGNHDKVIRKSEKLQSKFVWCRDLESISIKDENGPSGRQRIALCHYAMKVWHKSHYGAWQLHGHSHGSLTPDDSCLQLDVGVDEWGFTPVHYDTLKREMKKKNYIPFDYHGREGYKKDYKGTVVE